MKYDRVQWVIIAAFVVLCAIGITSNADRFFFGFGVAAFMRVVFKMTIGDKP